MNDDYKYFNRLMPIFKKDVASGYRRFRDLQLIDRYTFYKDLPKVPTNI